jgi:alkyl hydroperoxide reductase subunit AhpF
MALLSDQDHQVLSERFAETLEKDVVVKLFTQSQARGLLILPGQNQQAQSQSNEFMKVTQELLEELTSISPKLTLQVYDVFGDGADEAKRLQIEQLPAIVLGDDDEGRVRFYGAPVGNEFPTILTGIEALSKSGPMLTAEVAKVAIERIDEQVHLRVFVTPT